MKHLLLIEPDKVLADNLTSVFKRAGYKIDWQTSAQQAIDSADKTTPDIVILDLLLARKNGIEFLHEFRSYPEWQNVPVIIYSLLPASQLKDFTAELEALGITDILDKSTASLNDLIKAAKSLLATTKA